MSSPPAELVINEPRPESSATGRDAELLTELAGGGPKRLLAAADEATGKVPRPAIAVGVADEEDLAAVEEDALGSTVSRADGRPPGISGRGGHPIPQAQQTAAEQPAMEGATFHPG